MTKHKWPHLPQFELDKQDSKEGAERVDEIHIHVKEYLKKSRGE